MRVKASRMSGLRRSNLKGGPRPLPPPASYYASFVE
jgi:hypothetical protein